MPGVPVSGAAGVADGLEKGNPLPAAYQNGQRRVKAGKTGQDETGQKKLQQGQTHKEPVKAWSKLVKRHPGVDVGTSPPPAPPAPASAPPPAPAAASATFDPGAAVFDLHAAVAGSEGDAQWHSAPVTTSFCELWHNPMARVVEIRGNKGL